MMFYFKLLFAKNLTQVVDLVEEYIFHWSLEKIIEVTYSYKELEDGTLFNETLFEEYLNIPYSSKNDIAFLGRKYRYKIQVQLVYISDVLNKLAHIRIDSRSESIARSMLIDSLEYVKNILEITILSIDFELNKAHIPHNFTENQIEKRIEEIVRKEKLAFGGLVIEDSIEFSFCYNFLLNNHKQNKHQLERSDVLKMNRYLKIIKNSRRCELIDTPMLQFQKLEWTFLEKEIQRRDYRKVFDSVCELYGLPQRTKLSNAWSIYDGDSFLEIPRNESFATFPMERLLKLLTHEIESHYINSYNGRKLLWKFRGAKNLPKEEGLAMFMEKIFHGYTYETIDNIVEYFFTILAWECLTGVEFQEFMRIMVKEYKCMRSYDTAVLRAKRNYSIDNIWVQHKDVVYFRWLTEVIEYLKSGGEFRKLFLWKVWFLDVDNIYNIYQQYEEREEIVFPIFISDLIYYYFTEKEKKHDFIFVTQDYYLYLKKKYWFIDLDWFKIIKKIDKDWKEIEKILSMLEKIVTV